MTESERLKSDYRKLSSALDMRLTAELSAMQGYVLIELKEATIREGVQFWYDCLKEIGLHPRKASRKMQVALLCSSFPENLRLRRHGSTYVDVTA